MIEELLPKYLGMAVDLVYYHHERLHEDQVFPSGYFQELISGTRDRPEYWYEMKACLAHAMTLEDYGFSYVNSPFLEIYSKEDIRLFFKKFHDYLALQLNKNIE